MMREPPRPPGPPVEPPAERRLAVPRRGHMSLATVNGVRAEVAVGSMMTGAMTAQDPARKPENGDDHRPLTKAEGEQQLIDLLGSIEERLPEGDAFWSEVVEWRAKLRARRSRRGRRR